MSDILIIDDSGLCRELLCRSLEAHGYAATSAAPQDAICALRQANPGLLIIDPACAGGQGWQMLATVRRGGASPNLPVVIVSDQSDKRDIMQAANLGIRDYMLKRRFSFAELLTRVSRHVAPSISPQRPGESAAHAPRSGSPTAQAASLIVATPVIAPATAKRNSGEDDAQRELIDIADEIGIERMTRARTLERLESAPVKTLPGVVAELISLVNSPRGTVADVALILRRDPVMTARILRVANSAAFTSQRARIASVEDAVKNIGVAGVRNLVVNVGVFDAFATDTTGGLRVTRVWQHCLGVAMLMEKLAPQDEPAIPPGSAYLVGLCHDLAEIVLRQHFAAQYDTIATLTAKAGCSLRTAEKAIFGLPYGELASQLLTRLRLPPLITLPIEEFYERDEKRVVAGAGSLLCRRLRAANVYVHGLLLAPDAQQPITPLTRTECMSTFGKSVPDLFDDELLRGEALATATMLAGLTSSQTQQMCQPLVQQTPRRVCYCRHGDYASFDPLMAILRLTTREVQLLPLLSAAEPRTLRETDSLIVAGARSAGSEMLDQDVGHMRRLLNGRAIPALYLGATFRTACGTGGEPIAFRTLPLNIQSLGEFLTDQSGAFPTTVAA